MKQKDKERPFFRARVNTSMEKYRRECTLTLRGDVSIWLAVALWERKLINEIVTRFRLIIANMKNEAPPPFVKT